MTQGTQGGSVLSFVVIGGILVLLLLGGVYFVRQRTGAEAVNQPAPVSDQSKTESDKPKEDQAAKDKKDESSSETKPSTDSSRQQSSEVPAATLPQTGPAETFTALLATMLLTGALTAYIRSRREFLSL